jgi:hypothetical protein
MKKKDDDVAHRGTVSKSPEPPEFSPLSNSPPTRMLSRRLRSLRAPEAEDFLSAVPIYSQIPNHGPDMTMFNFVVFWK